MDNLEINPLVGVGPILFGMSRSQVRELLGAGFREFLKTPTSKSLTDDYAGYAIHVYYNPENSCKGIEFFKPAQVKLNGRMLLGDSFRNALRYFQHVDATVQLKSTGLLSTRFGISLYAPTQSTNPWKLSTSLEKQSKIDS